jgi:proteasome accessory factor B
VSQSERTERLLNLLFALMASSRPVPKHVLREAIDAYRESPSEEAFERMFERDKDELRGMGVPVETVEGSDGVGGIEGYRVAADAYALPEVEFTPDELAVLGVAARVWEQASLGDAAQRALRKLEALVPGVVVDGAVGVETRVATAEPSFPALLEAVRQRRAVRFDYRKPSEAAAQTREVQPWGVASRRGRWYLVAFDTVRGDARVFRLSRVLGAVTPFGPSGAYDVPEGIEVTRMIASSASGRQGATTARLQLAADRGHRLRRRGRVVGAEAGTEVVEVEYSDDEAFASELVGYGAAVVVVEPASLREAVVRRLRVAAGEGAA